MGHRHYIQTKNLFCLEELKQKKKWRLRTVKTAESNCAVTASYPREATKGLGVREQEHFLYLASLEENCGL